MEQHQRPNIVFIFADQMRGMDMGCAGNPDVHTPNMDRLAAEGIRMTHTYANNPVCGPSRGSLLTGRYPHQTGVIVNDFPLSPDIPSIGPRLQSAGYHTGYIGKWHLNGVPGSRWTPPGPERHGFQYWQSFIVHHRYFREEKVYDDAGQPVSLPGYDPEIQTNMAIDFIRRAGNDPFALFLSWGPPHDPYDQVPDDYKQMYDPAQLTLRPNVRTDTEYLRKNASGLDKRETLAHYYAAITALDDQLGRLMETIDELGIADNTILIFTSDHGDMLFSQGCLYKQKPWEESIHIPFLIRYPAKIGAGQLKDQLFSVVDMCPTLCGLAGLPALEGCQGQDLSGILTGKESRGPDAVLIGDLVSAFEGRRFSLPQWRGLRTSRYTFVRLQNGKPWLLYDNETDPYQLNNLVDHDQYKAVREQLNERLSERLKKAGDPFLDEKDMIRYCGLIELWNEHEQYMHPNDPHLI